jgi:hypothetical protein
MSYILKDIPNYEGLYQACSSGRIWSVPRLVTAGRHKHGLKSVGGRYLEPSTYSRYLIVGLNKDGVRRYYKVHNLIAVTFIGVRPDGLEINHIDGDRLNNSPDNLEYVTHQQNVDHSITLGLSKVKGVDNSNYKHGRYMR